MLTNERETQQVSGHALADTHPRLQMLSIIETRSLWACTVGNSRWAI